MPIALPPDQDRPGVPIAPPILFVIPILVSLLLEWLFPSSFVHGLLRWFGGATIFVLGVILNVTGFLTQRRAGTDPIPFNPSTRIVSHGLYRFSRNPMYIGFAFWTLGLALLLNSAWTLLAVPVGLILVDRLVVVREEAYLTRKFGEEYLRYKNKTRRWL